MQIEIERRNKLAADYATRLEMLRDLRKKELEAEAEHKRELVLAERSRKLQLSRRARMTSDR
jgi:hypothetical protein